MGRQPHIPKQESIDIIFYLSALAFLVWFD